MFGRFGGGGNFVAQYRCYPVSFIDRVRAPACPSARDAFNTPPDARMPPRALTLAPSANHAPRLPRSRNWRMAIKVRLDPREANPAFPRVFAKTRRARARPSRHLAEI
jgi:hypothetical protein